MGMTMTQKILAAHAGLPSVEAGQLIEANLDLVLGNDITTPVALKEMEKFNAKGVFHKEKIALVMDHFTPNKDIKSAENSKSIREFSKCQCLKHNSYRGDIGTTSVITCFLITSIQSCLSVVKLYTIKLEVIRYG